MTAVAMVLMAALLLGGCLGRRKTSVTTADLKQYLGQTRAETLTGIGKGADTSGTLALMESHMTFPLVWIEDLGLTLIFGTEYPDVEPLYILVCSETKALDVDLKGAQPGMEFKQIMNLLGDSEVTNTWIAYEECTAYRLDYRFEGLVWSFVSYDVTGAGSGLYIQLDGR